MSSLFFDIQKYILTKINPLFKDSLPQYSLTIINRSSCQSFIMIEFGKNFSYIYLNLLWCLGNYDHAKTRLIKP